SPATTSVAARRASTRRGRCSTSASAPSSAPASPTSSATTRSRRGCFQSLSLRVRMRVCWISSPNHQMLESPSISSLKRRRCPTELRTHSRLIHSPDTVCSMVSTSSDFYSVRSRQLPPTNLRIPPESARADGRSSSPLVRSLTVALLLGDGIGPEVVAEGTRILRAVANRFGHTIELSEGLIGGCALDALGTPLPPETIDLCQNADAVLLGAVGGPRWDDPNARQRPEQGLLGLRRALQVYANLRPVRVHPSLASASPLRAERLEGVDLLFVRELTGGMYFGDKRREKAPGGERAVDECVYTTTEIERVTRVAANIARTRRRKLTSVDKANVLETSRLWRSTVTRLMREEFPGV